MNNFDLRNYLKNNLLLKEVYDPPKRFSISELSISDSFLEFIKRTESYSRNAYPDGEFKDGSLRYSIGYGSQKYYNIPGRRNGAWVKEGETIDRETATDLLRTTLERYANEMDRYVNIDLSQSEFEASLSFMYNVGGVNFKSSSFLKELNKGNYEQAPELLKNWHRGWSNGKSTRHLLDNRREAEIELFLTDINKAKTDSGVDIDTKPEVSASAFNDVFDENGVAYGYDSVLNYLIGKYPEQELRIRDFIEDNYSSFFDGTINSKGKLEESYKVFLQDPVDVVDTVEKEPTSTEPSEVEPEVEPRPTIRRIKDDPGQNVRKVQDTEAPEVTTEPYRGNVVKIVEPKNPSADEPVEITKEKIVLPFLKKVGGKLASIWRDDIKGFVSEDLKNIYEEKVKEFLNKLFRKRTEAEKEASKLVKDLKKAEAETSEKQREEAKEAIERIAEFKADEYIEADVPEKILDEHKTLLLRGLTGELEELVGGRQYDDDVVGDYSSAFNNINHPLIAKLVQSEAEVGNAQMYNIMFIDGKVALFLATYEDLINKGVYMYQDEKGEWQHNLPKIKTDFYRYLNQQQDKNGWDFNNWDTELATGTLFSDTAPELGKSDSTDDGTDTNQEPDGNMEEPGEMEDLDLFN